MSSYRYRKPHTWMFLWLAGLICMAWLCSACTKTVDTPVAERMCEHFASLSMKDFPAVEQLTKEQRSKRRQKLTDYCMSKVDNGEELSPKEVACIEEAQTLDAIALCRKNHASPI